MKITSSLLAAAVAVSATLLSISTSVGAASYGALAEIALLDTTTTVLDTGAAPVSATYSGALHTATADTGAAASAQAAAGGIHLTAVANASVHTPWDLTNIYSRSRASGSFSDLFVLNAPSVAAGSLGTVTVAFVIDGSLGTTQNGPNPVPDGQGWGSSASWEASFRLYGDLAGVSWDGRRTLIQETWGTWTDGTADFGTLLFNMPIMFGGAYTIDLFGRVEARAGAITSLPQAATMEATAAALLGHTIGWGGIVDLRDANGVAITDFTALSDATGFDYANAYASAVPVPAAVWLLGSGLLALTGMARRTGA